MKQYSISTLTKQNNICPIPMWLPQEVQEEIRTTFEQELEPFSIRGTNLEFLKLHLDYNDSNSVKKLNKVLANHYTLFRTQNKPFFSQWDLNKNMVPVPTEMVAVITAFSEDLTDTQKEVLITLNNQSSNASEQIFRLLQEEAKITSNIITIPVCITTDIDKDYQVAELEIAKITPVIYTKILNTLNGSVQLSLDYESKGLQIHRFDYEGKSYISFAYPSAQLKEDLTNK